MFKGLKFGKSKKKTEEDKAGQASAATAEGMEKAGKSRGQPGDSDGEERQPGPHGPLVELSVEPGEDLEDLSLADDAADGNPQEESGEPVNLVELKPDTDAPAGDESSGKQSKAKEEEKKEGKSESSDDSFTSLFANDEEEDNPLANLIESLPDVTTSEIISDIAEIKEIMKEGH